MSDLDGRCFVRRGNTLVPADFAADEFMASLKEGREIILSARKARSPEHHRWFFALLRKVNEAVHRWASEDDLLDDLKLAVGHFTRRVNIITGEIQLVSKSINFASMPEQEFVEFRQRCVDTLAESIGVDPMTLMEEVRVTQERHSGNSTRALS